MNSKLSRNVLLNTSYQLLSMLVPLVTTPYVSRILGAEGIGVYSYSYSIVALLACACTLGADNHGNRMIAEVSDNIEERSKIFFSVWAAQACASVLMLAAYAVMLSFNHDYFLILLIQGIHLVAALANVNWYFYGCQRFDIMVGRNIIVRILTVTAIFILIKRREDVWLYVLILALGNLISCLSVWPFMLRKIKFIRICAKDILTQLRPMLILFIPIFASTFYQKIGKIMVTALSSVKEAGYFESVDKIGGLFVAIIASVSVVMIPHISQLLVSGKKNESVSTISKTLNFMLFLSTGIFFILIAISRDFAPIFFGPEFEACGILMMYFAPIIVIKIFSNFLSSSYLIPYKKDSLYTISMSIGMVLNVFLNAILISRIGALGAVISAVISEIVIAAIQMHSIRKELPIKKYMRTEMFFMLSGGFSISAIFLAQNKLPNGLFGIVVKSVILMAIYTFICAMGSFIRKKHVVGT